MEFERLVIIQQLKRLYIIKRIFWVPLGRYPSSCSQNITPYCPIKPLYNPYIGGICWYISRVLSQGYPTCPFDIKLGLFERWVMVYKGWLN